MKLKSKRIGLILLAILAVVLITYLAGPVSFVMRGGAHLPRPTGPYQIGRTRMALVDESREEIFTPETGDQREIVLNVFYPAEPGSKTKPGQYTKATGFQTLNGVPAFLVSPVTPNFVYDAPAVDDNFPVLVFGAASGGPVTYYTSLLEEIVSHGYIVLAIEHPYHFSAVYFPDGQIVKANDFGQMEGEYDTEMYKEQVSAVLVDDMRFALNVVEQLNQDDARLAGCFDLSRIGAFGHSMGGQSVAALGLVDERILASVNYDGSIIDERVIENGTRVPYLLVVDDYDPPPQELLDKYGETLEDWWKLFSERNYPESIRTGNAPFHVVQFIGSKHTAFYTDLAILKPMFPFVITEDMLGQVNGDTAVRAVSAVTLAYFDAYLNEHTTTNEALASTDAALRPSFDTSDWGIDIEK